MRREKDRNELFIESTIVVGEFLGQILVDPEVRADKSARETFRCVDAFLTEHDPIERSHRCDPTGGDCPRFRLELRSFLSASSIAVSNSFLPNATGTAIKRRVTMWLVRRFSISGEKAFFELAGEYVGCDAYNTRPNVRLHV
jgi:hypothetical protein